MSDIPANRPPAAARGTLGKTPALHLLLYALEKSLTGSMEFDDGSGPADPAASLFFSAGQPVKARTRETVSHLGRVLLELGHLSEDELTHSLAELARAKSAGHSLHGQILLEKGIVTAAELQAGLREQLARLLRFVALLGPETAYAYYDGFDLLAGWGVDSATGHDPIPMIWGMLCANPPEAHVSAALERVAASRLRLSRGSRVDCLGLPAAPRRVAELLAERSLRASELLQESDLGEGPTRLLLYLLLVTKQVELVRSVDASGAESMSAAEARMTPTPGHPSATTPSRPSKAYVIPSAPRPSPASPIPVASRMSETFVPVSRASEGAIAGASRASDTTGGGAASRPSGAPAVTPTHRTSETSAVASVARGSDPEIARASRVSQTSPVSGSSRPSDPDIARALRATDPDIARALRASNPDIARALPASNPDIARALRASDPDIARALRASDPDIARASRASDPDVSRASRITQTSVSGAFRASVTSPTAKSTPPRRPSPPGLSAELAARWAEVTERAATIDSVDYFVMLDIPRDASREDVEMAFFALAKKWHPDRLSPELASVRTECSRVFARMSEAHATLSDANSRGQYMNLLADGSGTPMMQETVLKVVEAATDFQKAEVCLRRSDYAQAETLCRKALDADPTQSDYLAMFAWLVALKPENQSPEKTKDSIQMLDRAISMGGRPEKAHFWRGMLNKRLGKADTAFRDFKTAVELNPRNIDAAREVRLHRMRRGSRSSSSPPTSRRSTPPPGAARTSSPSFRPEEAKPGLLGRLFKKS